MNRVRTSMVIAGCVLALAGCGSSASGASTTTVATGGTLAPIAGATIVTPAEGKALIDQLGGALTILDVRTPSEFAAGHIQGAVNLDLESGDFSTKVAALPRDHVYLVYCHTGRRAGMAVTQMVADGFTKVYDVGGILQWQAAGLPLVTN